MAKSVRFVSPLLACIESFAKGDDEPIPTKPVLFTLKMSPQRVSKTKVTKARRTNRLKLIVRRLVVDTDVAAKECVAGGGSMPLTVRPPNGVPLPMVDEANAVSPPLALSQTTNVKE